MSFLSLFFVFQATVALLAPAPQSPPLRTSSRRYANSYGTLFPSIEADLDYMERRIIQRVSEAVSHDETRSGGVRPLLEELTSEQSRFPFRAVAVMLLGKALDPTLKDKQVSVKHCLLAEIVEMMHTSQVIHETVLDFSDGVGEGNVFHRTYGPEIGNKVSVLAGDYLLAQCSVELGNFGRVDIVETMGESLQRMVHGSLLRSRHFSEKGGSSTSSLPSFASYQEQMTLRTCALLRDACGCAAALSGHDAEGPVARSLADFGYHLSMAYQAAKDIAVYDLDTSNSGGAFMAPGFRATLPVVLAANASPEAHASLSNIFSSHSVPRTDLRAIVDRENGKDLAITFANDCATKAHKCLLAIPAISPEEHSSLERLVKTVLDRTICLS